MVVVGIGAEAQLSIEKVTHLLQSPTREISDRAPRLVLAAVSQLVSQDCEITIMMVREEHMVPECDGTSTAGD
jgi:hypothetical protein